MMSRQWGVCQTQTLDLKEAPGIEPICVLPAALSESWKAGADEPVKVTTASPPAVTQFVVQELNLMLRLHITQTNEDDMRKKEKQKNTSKSLQWN